MNGEAVLRPALQCRTLQALCPIVDEADGLHLVVSTKTKTLASPLDRAMDSKNLGCASPM